MLPFYLFSELNLLFKGQLPVYGCTIISLDASVASPIVSVLMEFVEVMIIPLQSGLVQLQLRSTFWRGVTLRRNAQLRSYEHAVTGAFLLRDEQLQTLFFAPLSKCKK